MTRELQNILYVEDDESIAEIAVMALEGIGGFTVTHAPDGNTALQRYSAVAPDLVLMDVMMPGKSGIETVEELRASDLLGDTPVIFMTAKAQLHEQAGYRKLGAAGVIVKPFDPMTLSDEITAIWEGAIKSG